MAGPNGEEKSRLMVSSSSGIGYCYPDHTSSSSGNQNINFVRQLQGFDHHPNTAEMYNLTSGMEMIGFSSKNHHHHHSEENNTSSSVLWKEFFNKPHHEVNQSVAPSSSKPINEFSSYQHGFNKDHDLSLISDTTTNGTTLMDSSSAAWNHQHQNRLMVHVDDQSLRCAFTCEGNERPSQGLSLSLSSSNPSSIGLQSFELIHHHGHGHDHDLRFGPSSSRSVLQNPHHEFFQIRSSKYLGPAQELLNEFCFLGTKKNIEDISSKVKGQKISEWQDENAIKSQSLYSLDLLELQRRKSKLIHMLEEVDRRYKHYCDQMKSVVSSFEAVAGHGAATVYSALASRAMSGHFRRLKDGIVTQIKATKKAMGEKDTAAPGTSKGETPRLRLLDQTLRQQRVFQQMTMMETHPWRPQRGLPERSVSVLRAWLFEHFLHPYPSDVDKHILARQTGLSRSQVSNWFINARVRLWKPMVEEMYLEELKDHETDDNEESRNLSPSTNEDQKPSHDELIRMDSECLSSIVHSNHHQDKSKASLNYENHEHGFGRVGDHAMELDFSSYGGPENYGGGGSGGGGVSLTLGLHQHQQGTLLYPERDQMEDCQTVQYSLLDTETQTLPYRNLMGAQLLHDLAG